RTLETRIKLDYTPTDIFKVYLEGNLVKVWGDASGEDETGTSQSLGRYAELRQYFFKVNNMFGSLPMYAQVGRQRFSDPYAFLWNRDIDAVRIGYDGSLVNSFVAFGENVASYRTSEGDFDANAQDIGRLLGEVTWAYAYKNSLSARVLHINDHSGTDPVGYVFAPRARDDEDVKLTWTDLRATGRVSALENIMSDIRYRADGAVVMGDTTTVTSSSVAPTSDLRRVTATNSRDVMGWAFDGDINMTLALPLAPTLIFGYAYGSGDDGQGQDTSFHQPDLRGNSSRQGDSTGASHNYGEALRPDLTNLHIVKAGIGITVMKASDIMMTYRYYLLDHKETGLSNSHVSASVT
ncbi:MAG: alginate export family protein, partial [Pseudomonadota bacterium]